MKDRVKSVGVEGSEPMNPKLKFGTKTIGQPPMANTPGPKGPVGPIEDGKFPGPSVGAAVERSARMAQLDPQMVLRVELLATKKQLADNDEKMGLWAVQDARRRKQELDREEAVMMAEVSRQLGAPAGSSITLVDRQKGLCKVE